VGRTAVPLNEWVAAVAPSGRLLEMAALPGKAVSNITELTTLALQLYYIITTMVIPTSFSSAQEYGLNATKLPSKWARHLELGVVHKTRSHDIILPAGFG
jgi:hypothetical protein